MKCVRGRFILTEAQSPTPPLANTKRKCARFPVLRCEWKIPLFRLALFNVLVRTFNAKRVWQRVAMRRIVAL